MCIIFGYACVTVKPYASGLFVNRFIELNETKMQYNVKTDKNSAPVQRTNRTLRGL